MKTAIVCIAKNEDHYIDEWLNYHLKLGFSNIFIYQNNWRYVGDKSQYGDKVEWIEFDGDYMQLKAYNDFINNRRDNFEYAAFIDIDEFICLKLYDNISSFLQNYTDVYGIGLSWKMFGDNGLTAVVDDNYNVIDRFIRCQPDFNKHIKTLLNLKRTRNMFHFINPHFVDASLTYNIIIDVAKNHFIRGPFDLLANNDIAWINHYYCKTKAEFAKKIENGRADCPNGGHGGNERTFQHFNDANHNEVENTIVKDFWHRV